MNHTPEGVCSVENQLKGTGRSILRKNGEICTLTIHVENKKQKLITLCWWVVLTNAGTIAFKIKSHTGEQRERGSVPSVRAGLESGARSHVRPADEVLR